MREGAKKEARNEGTERNENRRREERQTRAKQFKGVGLGFSGGGNGRL
jgi:hypothetical protein